MDNCCSLKTAARTCTDRGVSVKHKVFQSSFTGDQRNKEADAAARSPLTPSEEPAGAMAGGQQRFPSRPGAPKASKCHGGEKRCDVKLLKRKKAAFSPLKETTSACDDENSFCLPSSLWFQNQYVKMHQHWKPSQQPSPPPPVLVFPSAGDD